MNDPVLMDLIAEQAQVDILVADLSEEQWNMKQTVGWSSWTIKDTIAHVAGFDLVALRLMRGDAQDIHEAMADLDPIPEKMLFHHFGGWTGAQVLDYWREQRTLMDAFLFEKNPKDRVPWAPGLPMAAKSLCSARLMELWAHSVDIYGTLGVPVVVKDRISATLFLSWQSRPQAYRIHGEGMPDVPLYLELTLPSGATWAKGDESAENWIKGDAAEWAQVAIKRLNWRDTHLDVHGEEAQRFASFAQAFAGPAEPEPPRKRA